MGGKCSENRKRAMRIAAPVPEVTAEAAGSLCNGRQIRFRTGFGALLAPKKKTQGGVIGGTHLAWAQ